MPLTGDSTISDLLIEAAKKGERRGINPIEIIAEMNGRTYRFEIRIAAVELTEEEKAEAKIRTIN